MALPILEEMVEGESVRRMREERRGEDLDILAGGWVRERMRGVGADRSKVASGGRGIRRGRQGAGFGWIELLTDEDLRPRERLLPEPLVERVGDLARELEVLRLVLADGDVGRPEGHQSHRKSVRESEADGRSIRESVTHLYKRMSAAWRTGYANRPRWSSESETSSSRPAFWSASLPWKRVNRSEKKKPGCERQ